MFAGFADITATNLQVRSRLPELCFDVPLVDDRLPHGLLRQPKLYLIMGQAQTYKTTLAVQLLSPFLATHLTSLQAIWIDADLRFPIDLLQERGLHLEKLTVTSCRSSEEILFALLDIDYQLACTENLIHLRSIVIDGINSSFWIDEAARPFAKKPMRWALRDAVEKLVTAHAINVIVVMQDLGDFEIWKEANPATTVKLRCNLISPQNGMLESAGFQHRFTVKQGRIFEWGRRSLGSDPEKTPS
jgi:hypothetical protein